MILVNIFRVDIEEFKGTRKGSLQHAVQGNANNVYLAS